MKKVPVLLIGILFLTACSYSTANLSEVKMCTKIQDNQCQEDVTTFSPDTPEIFVSTRLNNAPENTKVTFQWKYLEGEGVDIDSITLDSTEISNTMQSSLEKPEAGWPAGRYEVILSLHTDNSEPIHKEFKVQ